MPEVTKNLNLPSGLTLQHTLKERTAAKVARSPDGQILAAASHSGNVGFGSSRPVFLQGFSWVDFRKNGYDDREQMQKLIRGIVSKHQDYLR